MFVFSFYFVAAIFIVIARCNESLAWSASHQQRQFLDQGRQFNITSRRPFLQQWAGATIFGLLLPSSAHAEIESKPDDLKSSNAEKDKNEGLMSAKAIADLLHPIPTFVIVDKKGVPFTVVGEDAKVTGYFFTTYGEADRLLRLAKVSSDRAIKKAKAEGEEGIGANPWVEARISTIPLDFAVTLVFKSLATRGGGIYFKIAPAEGDTEDALAITGQTELTEGRVPLFYYADFAIDDGDAKRSPLFFRKSELEQEFRRMNPGSKPPQVMVTELFSLITQMGKPGGIDDELKSLILMSPRESSRKRELCEKVGGQEAPFVIGQRIIVL